jgi:hypothetical protein
MLGLECCYIWCLDWNNKSLWFYCIDKNCVNMFFCKATQLLTPSYLVNFLHFRKLNDILYYLQLPCFHHLSKPNEIVAFQLWRYGFEHFSWRYGLLKRMIYWLSVCFTLTRHHSQIELLLKTCCFHVWVIASNGMSLFPFDATTLLVKHKELCHFSTLPKKWWPVYFTIYIRI